MKLKLYFFIPSLMISFLIASGQESINSHNSAELKILVKELKNNKGKVIAYLFADTHKESVQAYPKQEHSIKFLASEIINNSVTFKFDDLPKGEYAFYLHHDENNDGKMNTNLIGMPTEGYSFSNNAKPGMTGLPDFARAKISLVSSSRKIETTLTY